MAQQQFMTATRALDIEGRTVVDGDVDAAGNLILRTYGGATINAGNIKGPKGDPGAKGDPGVKGDPGTTLPTATAATANTLALRDANGRFSVASPIASTEAATKGYVDGKIAGFVLGSTNLNAILTDGNYFQSDSAVASTLLSYPEAIAGLLEVFSLSGQTYQRYTPFTNPTDRFYLRVATNTSWTPWAKVGAPTYVPGVTKVTGATANAISATAWAAIPNTSLTANITVTVPTLVTIVLAGWLVKTQTTVEFRAGVSLSGATTMSEESPSWGSTIQQTGGFAFSGQKTMTKSAVLNVGTTTFTARAYVNTAAANFNYPVLEIIPIRAV